MTGDGLSISKTNLDAKSSNYARGVAYALVEGELHIFGGASDSRKVSSF